MASNQGWRLVPIEPTEEMVQVYEDQTGAFDSAQELHAALLAVAPAAPGVDLGKFREAIEYAIRNWKGNRHGFATMHILLAWIDSQHQPKEVADV